MADSETLVQSLFLQIEEMRNQLSEKDTKIKKLQEELDGKNPAAGPTSSKQPPEQKTEDAEKKPLSAPSAVLLGTQQESAINALTAPKPPANPEDPLSDGNEKDQPMAPEPAAPDAKDEPMAPAAKPAEKDAPADPAPTDPRPENAVLGTPPPKEDEKEEDEMTPEDMRNRVQAMVTELETTEQKMDALYDEHTRRQEQTIEKFCGQSVEMMKSFNSDLGPLTTKVNEANEPISKLLKGRFLVIAAEDLETLRFGTKGTKRMGPWVTPNSYTPAAVTAKQWIAGPGHGYNSSGQPLRKRFKVEMPQRELVMGYFNQLDRAKKQAEHKKAQEIRKKEQEKRQEDMKKKIAENRESGAVQILGIFPFMTIDMTKTCLEAHDDNLEKAVAFLGGMPAEEVFSAVQAKKMQLEQKKAHNKGFGGGMGPSYRGRLQGVSSLARDGVTKKKIVVQVVNVQDGSRVTIKTVIDRNRLPLTQPSKTFVVNLRKLCKLNFAFCDKEMVDTVRKTRKLKLVYQVEDQHFIPVGVEPADVPFQEYTPNWDQRSKTMKSIAHKAEGEVEFTGVLDTNKGVMNHGEALEIHTQVVDEQTLNVVLLCLDHYDPEMTLDFENLTHTSKTPKDCEEFKADAAGRKPSYRILVKDSKVLAILSPFGDEIKHLPFVENPVPAVGSLVALDSTTNSLGLVERVPTGLIISNADRNVNVVTCQFTRQKACTRRHTSEMDGFVDVKVVRRNGTWLDEPANEAHNVVYMTAPSQDAQTQFLTREEEQKEPTDEEAFVQKLADVEALLEALKLAEDKKAAFQEIQKLWSEVNALAQKVDPNIAEKEKSRRTNIGRSIRSIAYDIRAKG